MSISKATKQLLSERSDKRCEYCLLPEAYAIKKHEPDHIIPKKHGGKDSVNNLAWACFACNRFKGSEVGAFEEESGELFPIFNPRKQSWADHFSLSSSGQIVAKTPIGRVTIIVMQFNRPHRIDIRSRLINANLYL